MRTLAHAFDERAAGRHPSSDDALALVESVLDGGGVTKTTLIEAANVESARFVLNQ